MKREKRLLFLMGEPYCVHDNACGRCDRYALIKAKRHDYLLNLSTDCRKCESIMRRKAYRAIRKLEEKK